MLKSGPLVHEERETMKCHVNHGMDIIQHSDWLEDATDVVLYHHEQFDGKGYPCGLVGEDIPVTARIFAIADVFDALMSRRPYKEPMPYEKAIETLEQGRGSHFDPVILNAFNEIAPALHQEVSNLSEEALQEKLVAMTRQYFTREMYEKI
ncbi:MAG: HD domain-containing protein [Geobacteraceae bacterium]|nr:HD domain-containing protein [Geobacteraceae bacterium]